MNIQHRLIEKHMLYDFELVHNATEATKKKIGTLSYFDNK